MAFRCMNEFERQLLLLAADKVAKAHSFAETVSDDELIERQRAWARGYLRGLEAAAKAARELAGAKESPLTGLLDHIADFYMPKKEGEW